MPKRLDISRCRLPIGPPTYRSQCRIKDILLFSRLARLSQDGDFALQKRTATACGISEDQVSEALDRLENSLEKVLVEVGPPTPQTRGRKAKGKPSRKSKGKRTSRLTFEGKMFGVLALCIRRIWTHAHLDGFGPAADERIARYLDKVDKALELDVEDDIQHLRQISKGALGFQLDL